MSKNCCIVNLFAGITKITADQPKSGQKEDKHMRNFKNEMKYFDENCDSRESYNTVQGKIGNKGGRGSWHWDTSLSQH